MAFSENLVHRRKALGLSQEELAGKLQVSRQAVSKWETGDAMPDLPNLLALAEALSLSLDTLCGRHPQAVASQTAPIPAAKTSRLWPALCVILLCLLSAAALWTLHRQNIVPAKEAAAESTLPDTFSVTGIRFEGQKNAVAYSFVPSVTGSDYTYQISFTDSSGSSRVFDAVCEGGICTGIAVIAPYDTFQVTATVSDGVSSRSTAIALNLSFSAYSASWLPVDA